MSPARPLAIVFVLAAVGCFSLGSESKSSSGCNTGECKKGPIPAHASGSTDPQGCVSYRCDFGWAGCGQDCNTHLVDDSANCGACGNACTESACKLGSCGVVRELAVGLVSPTRVATGGGYVYFVAGIDEGGSETAIFRVPRDGGASEQIAVTNAVVALEASNAGVFWIENGEELRGVRAGDRAVVTLASALDGAMSLVVDDDNAAWLSRRLPESDAGTDASDGGNNARSGGVWTMPLAAGSPSLLVAFTHDYSSSFFGQLGDPLAQSGDWLVFVDGLDNVRAVRRSSGATVTLASKIEGAVLGVAADDSFAYWYSATLNICLGGACSAPPPHLFRAPLGGGDVVEIPTNALSPRAARWGELYAIDEAGRAVVRIDMVSGARHVIAGGLGEIEGLAVDDASIYWIAHGASRSDGRLMSSAR